MASISFLGVGSNLDLSSLLDQLSEAEKLPLKQLETQASSYQAKLSAYGTVKSVLSAYQTAAKKLADAATFGAAKATVASADVLSASAGSNAVPGSYTVNVTSLAQAHSIASKNIASRDSVIGTGTITFDFGELTGGGTPVYTADASRTKTVNITPEDNTVEGIRDAINKANIGVTASLVNDGSGTPYRLVLTSNATGDKSTMRISATGTLGDLVAFDPTQATQSNGMTETVKAASAKLSINGINVVSQSNTVADAAQGVTLNLAKVGTTSLNVTRDVDSIKSAIQGFVTAYNNIQAAATTLTAFDVDSQSAAALTGDGTLRGIQTKLRSMMNVPLDNGTGGRIMLSDIGVAFTEKGTLAIDDAKLTKALQNDLAGMTALFSGTDGTGGLGKQIDEAIEELNDTDGALTVVTDGLTEQLKDMEDRYDAMEARINSTIERYRSQFTQLDLLVSQMNRTSAYLTQQFASLGSQTQTSK